MNSIIDQFIADAGNIAQSFGLGRVVGQIYAYLYFSQEPQGLNDMQEVLHISKGSASTCVRQLEQWGAVRRVWVKGDRKDYYEANDWFGKILKNVLNDAIAKRFAHRDEFYEEIESSVAALNGSKDAAFLKERIAHIQQFEAKAQKVWNNPMVKKLLG
jgi:HTH-type transcriptional regulator, glycine betaine synthesis regulator